MSRPRKSIPSYLPHQQSGRARAVWTDFSGARQYRMLPGPFDSPESRSAFAKLLLELEATPHVVPGASTKTLTVSEVLLAFIDHAERYYRNSEGETTHEYYEYQATVKHIRELYGNIPAATFGPLALKTVRQRFIAAGWSRGFVNQRVGRVRRIFKWAVSEELVPPLVYQGLTAVSGLKRGRTEARETEPVLPVDDSVVDATIPFLNRHVRGMVEFQRLTGCRPGEACALRRCDLDTNGPVLLYKPAKHKTAWRGKSRTISIGPRAQMLLQEFFSSEIEDYLFSPLRAVEEVRTERAANRKTPLYPSHMARNASKRKLQPKRQPAEKYTRLAYRQAIARACDRAFPTVGDLSQRSGESVAKWWARLTMAQRAEVTAWRKKHRWHPNQLRHTFATKVRKEYGLEAAQVLLGHSKADVTQIYAERNDALAASVASRVG